MLGRDGDDAQYIVEHPTIPFVSYPYEWSFSELKAAALLHLDLQKRALDYGLTMSDASAYNVQFLGPSPTFIDILSFRPYREGEFWLGHRQFCEQFINPLLLRAYLGIPHNSWYRGSLEGIPPSEIGRLLPWWRKFSSWNVFSHVFLQAKAQSWATNQGQGQPSITTTKRLPREAYSLILGQLQRWIRRLSPKGSAVSTWSDYVDTRTYSDDEVQAKRNFVDEFVRRVKPQMLWDVGCNTGEYSQIAIDAGAGRVIGFDFDQGVLDVAFTRAVEERLDFLPLFLDAANPSPGQGWKEKERKGIQERAEADALIALAFAHHLTIGRNIPIDQVAEWLTSMAPVGIVEFVQKDDPTVQQMLRDRDDIFPNYTEETFLSCIQRHARIVKMSSVSSSNRKLIWYECK